MLCIIFDVHIAGPLFNRTMSKTSLPKVAALLTCLLNGLNISASLSISNEANIARRPSLDEYMLQRQDLIKTQFAMGFEGGVILNHREQLANKIIMQLKTDEIQIGLAYPSNFTPARHLFEVMDEIEASQLFQIIKQMPKGGALHAHASAICGPDCLVRFTYYDHMWQCNHTDNGIVRFRFKQERPTETILGSEDCVWSLVADVRHEMGAALYDKTIRTLFTLVTDRPRETYSDLNMIWRKFSNILDLTGSIIKYAPLLKEYYKQALRNFYADGVQYVELRGGTINEVQ